VDSVQELENTKARLQACGVEVLGVTDHHIFKSIYFFDPNGIRLELTAQLADELQMLKESKTAHARLDEWTARKEQWRKERAEGKSSAPLKPQNNDRPEFVPCPLRRYAASPGGRRPRCGAVGAAQALLDASGWYMHIQAQSR
jgi:glyoxylase I family protein